MLAFGEHGYELHRGVVPAALVADLVEATDGALAAESMDFPAHDEQHGRLLFAPAHGGPFIDLLDEADLFRPLESALGPDSILYTMTTSVLAPGSAGPIDEFHVDLAADRPDGQAVSAIVMLDAFTETSGATEFMVGPTTRDPGRPVLEQPTDAAAVVRIVGGPGDVCYFDPRVPHRSTRNDGDRPRRAVLIQMVKPWMKQRVDVRAMVVDEEARRLSEPGMRRLGLASLPPRSRAEFLERRQRRPWNG